MTTDNSSCSKPDGHFQDDTNVDRGFGDSPLKHMLEGDDPVCSVQEQNGKSIQEKIEPFIQYHEPLITISTMKEKYWHCNSPIVIDGKMTRHSVYLGIKDKFEGKTDKKLVKLAQRKMGDLLKLDDKNQII